MRHVKIDLGNQFTKHTENNLRVYSTTHGIVCMNDSQVAEAIEAISGVEALNPRDYIRVYDSVNSRHYQLYNVGESALQKHGTMLARQARGASRYTSNYAVPLILNVLRQYPDADGDYSLVLMFPPSNAMYVKDYVQAVKKSWKIGDGADTRVINIKHIEVFMEGLGSIVNAVQGNLAPIKSDQYYLAIDVGSFTTDLVMATNHGVFIPGMAYSLENYGINSIKEKLQISIRRQFKNQFTNAAVLEDDDFLESVLTSKRINIKNRSTEDATPIVNDVTSELVNAILNGVSQRFERHVNRINGVLLTGGGSSLLHTILRERIDFGHVYLADERKSLYKANVRGAHYYYESLLKTGMVKI